MQGYWTGAGVAATVDWCEPNYAVTHYVAEFWNTLSSGWILMLGLYGAWRAWHGGPAERRFVVAFTGLAVVGAGSIAFHGTLLRVSQALDELPMVYLGLIAVWMLAHREGGEGRQMAAWMTLYALGFTAAYGRVEQAFEIFLATYAGLITWVVVQSVRLTWMRPSPKLLSNLLRTSALGYLGSLAFFWIPEHVLFACDDPIQRLQLHSWWHLGAGTGSYTWLMWAMTDRVRAEGRRPMWEGTWVRDTPRD